LEPTIRDEILGYHFSVQILPSQVEDRDVLQIFARLNSTGTRLNGQELRNAEWFGPFKTRMYDLAYEQLERWLQWKIFSEEEISRMLEVELVSDLTINILQGLTGKTQTVLKRFYREYEGRFPDGPEVSRRFRQTMDTIDRELGSFLANSVFTRQMHFFTLFVYMYDRLYGLKSDLKRRSPRSLPRGLATCMHRVNDRLRGTDLPDDVLKALSGAATDVGRRRSLFDFMTGICGAKAGR